MCKIFFLNTRTTGTKSKKRCNDLYIHIQFLLKCHHIRSTEHIITIVSINCICRASLNWEHICTWGDIRWTGWQLLCNHSQHQVCPSIWKSHQHSQSFSPHEAVLIAPNNILTVHFIWAWWHVERDQSNADTAAFSLAFKLSLAGWSWCKITVDAWRVCGRRVLSENKGWTLRRIHLILCSHVIPLSYRGSWDNFVIKKKERRKVREWHALDIEMPIPSTMQSKKLIENCQLSKPNQLLVTGKLGF